MSGGQYTNLSVRQHTHSKERMAPGGRGGCRGSAMAAAAGVRLIAESVMSLATLNAETC
jgi:hypothetical protein